MKGLKDPMNYKYCGEYTTNEVTRAVKGGRFKLYCVSFASSNLAPHIELFLMSDIISKMVLIEPDVGGCSLVVIMLSLGDKTSKRSRVQLSASPSYLESFLKPLNS